MLDNCRYTDRTLYSSTHRRVASSSNPLLFGHQNTPGRAAHIRSADLPPHLDAFPVESKWSLSLHRTKISKLLIIDKDFNRRPIWRLSERPPGGFAFGQVRFLYLIAIRQASVFKHTQFHLAQSALWLKGHEEDIEWRCEDMAVLAERARSWKKPAGCSR